MFCSIVFNSSFYIFKILLILHLSFFFSFFLLIRVKRALKKERGGFWDHVWTCLWVHVYYVWVYVCYDMYVEDRTQFSEFISLIPSQHLGIKLRLDHQFCLISDFTPEPSCGFEGRLDHGLHPVFILITGICVCWAVCDEDKHT